jgi:hypothetical protein
MFNKETLILLLLIKLYIILDIDIDIKYMENRPYRFFYLGRYKTH